MSRQSFAVSPVEAAFNSVTRAISSFHPAAVPRLARAHYRRELVAWFFLSTMMGVVEGGVVSVIAKNAFAGAVPDLWLDRAVAVLASAPAFANVTSILWAWSSHGRHKIRYLFGLQIAAVVLIAQVAFAPDNGLGLLMLIAACLGARVCWAGVVTLRTTVWRSNYPAHLRATMAGKITTIQAIVLSAVALTISLAMSENDSAYKLIYPVTAGFGLVGALVYRRMRMRGHAALLRDELRVTENGPALVSPLQVWRLLAEDRLFGRYMGAMFVFGLGNIMIMAPLVILLSDEFGYGYRNGILITTVIPILVMAMTIPVWSRMLDRMHIIRFRTIHCWAFVATNICLLLAAALHLPVLLWVTAVLRGVAFGGGVLGWNLGHHDFSPPELSSQYMGVHVTLTGVRGFIAMFLPIGLYQLFDAWHDGAGYWVFAVCLALNLAGAYAFARLRHEIPAGQELRP